MLRATKYIFSCFRVDHFGGIALLYKKSCKLYPFYKNDDKKNRDVFTHTLFPNRHGRRNEIVLLTLHRCRCNVHSTLCARWGTFCFLFVFMFVYQVYFSMTAFRIFVYYLFVVHAMCTKLLLKPLFSKDI